MIFIFDLDDTLMDTKALKDRIFSLMHKSGANMQEILESYQKTYEMPELYSPVAHIDNLYNQNNLVDKDLFLNDYEKIDYASLLFPKTKEILAEAREIGAVILMTRGHHLFQARKIIASGIDEYFDDIIITNKTKDEYVPRFENYPRVIVINDKVPENEQMSAIAPEFTYINLEDLSKDWERVKKIK